MKRRHFSSPNVLLNLKFDKRIQSLHVEKFLRKPRMSSRDPKKAVQAPDVLGGHGCSTPAYSGKNYFPSA